MKNNIVGSCCFLNKTGTDFFISNLSRTNCVDITFKLASKQQIRYEYKKPNLPEVIITYKKFYYPKHIDIKSFKYITINRFPTMELLTDDNIIDFIMEYSLYILLGSLQEIDNNIFANYKTDFKKSSIFPKDFKSRVIIWYHDVFNTYYNSIMYIKNVSNLYVTNIIDINKRDTYYDVLKYLNVPMDNMENFKLNYTIYNLKKHGFKVSNKYADYFNIIKNKNISAKDKLLYINNEIEKINELFKIDNIYLNLKFSDIKNIESILYKNPTARKIVKDIVNFDDVRRRMKKMFFDN